MPRIRTVKPEFWGDEKLAPMSPIDRLVFLGLISMADDAGRLLDNVKAIDGFVFPETSDSSRDSLDRLGAGGRIVRYVSESGQRLIQVTNWKRHQKIDHPAKYVLPPPPCDDSRDSREDDAKSSLSDQRPATNDQRPPTNERSDRVPPADAPPEKVAACALTASSITLANMPPDVVEFGARFYGKAAPDRRRKIANQLLRLARGEGVRYKGALVRAGSLARLARTCRDVLDGNDMRKADLAIAVLLTKLGDSTDVSSEKVKLEEQRRATEQQDSLRDAADAEAWLADRGDLAASIDAELEQQGYVAGGDAIKRMARKWARGNLVINAWRAAGAPVLAKQESA